jgi:hypothetical protein
MLRAVIVLATALGIVTLAPAARAEPTRAPGARDGLALEGPAGSSLDLSLELGADGFRLGGRLFAHGGYAGGAWLDGLARRDGFRLDGGLEHGGRSHGFTFDADLGEWLGRARRARDVTDL